MENWFEPQNQPNKVSLISKRQLRGSRIRDLEQQLPSLSSRKNLYLKAHLTFQFQAEIPQSNGF